MIKILVACCALLALSACSHVKISAAMCDQIMNDPSHPQIPQECRDYSEKEAEKAFNKVTDEKKVSDQDIKFIRDEE